MKTVVEYVETQDIPVQDIQPMANLRLDNRCGTGEDGLPAIIVVQIGFDIREYHTLEREADALGETPKHFIIKAIQKRLAERISTDKMGQGFTDALAREL